MVPRTIILTGASRGIGLAVAHALLKAPEANNVVAVARNKSSLDSLKEQYPKQVEVLAGDLSDFSYAKKAVELAISAFGQLDGLILNHGILDPVTRMVDANAKEWSKNFDTNFFSVVAFIQAAIPALRKSKGKVILVSSGAAVSGFASWGAYGSSKAAMNHVALTMKTEEPDITTIAIRPGIVDTEMQRQLREVHLEKLDKKEQDRFSNAHKDRGTPSGLLRPDQPGDVMARLVLAAPSDLSGSFLSWDDDALRAFQD